MEPLKTLYVEPTLEQQLADFYPARIMNPAEVAGALSLLPSPLEKMLHKRWMLCGDVGASTFAAMKDANVKELAFRLSAFGSSHGGHYAVMTHQLKAHQHRFVLPLWSPECIALMRALQTERHGFMLGCAGETDAVVFPGIVSASEMKPLLRFCGEVDEAQAKQLLAECPLVIAALGQLGAIPSVVPDERVSQASMSFVIPWRVVNAYVPGRGGYH